MSVPEGWETGWIYNPTDDKWRVLGVADLDDLETLKYWARVGHDALVRLAGGVIALYPYYAPAQGDKTLAWLANAHPASTACSGRRTGRRRRRSRGCRRGRRGRSTSRRRSQFMEAAAVGCGGRADERGYLGASYEGRFGGRWRIRLNSRRTISQIKWATAPVAKDLINGAWIDDLT